MVHRFSRIGLCLAVMLVSLWVFPEITLAQEGNPLADETNRNNALEFLDSLVFWMWVSAGLGGIIFVASFLSQQWIPEFIQNNRFNVRIAAILVGFSPMVLSFCVEQARNATILDVALWVPLEQVSRMLLVLP